MKNILGEKPIPYQALSGRLKYSCEFVGEHHLKDKVILNIGCGFGWFELFCTNRNAQAIHAIEVDSESLASAQKNLQDPRIIFSVANGLALPMADQTFDTIVCWEVLEHLPRASEKQFFSEIFRVLKPGGQFYMSTPFRSLLSTILDPAWWLIGHRHYSEQQIRTFVEKSGLHIMTIERKGGIWEILSWWNLYIAKWIFRRRPFFAKYFDKKTDFEFSQQKIGFTNIFAHIEKP